MAFWPPCVAGVRGLYFCAGTLHCHFPAAKRTAAVSCECSASLLLQSLSEQHHCLAIDLCVVPLSHDLEILGAFAEGRSSAPTVDLQQIGGRGQHIRHAVAEIDMTVAVIIDTVLEIG